MLNTLFSSTNVFKIDDKQGIIAAGPVIRVNCGVLGERFVRGVLRINHEGSRYRTSIQDLNDNGDHDGYDATAGQTFDDYKEAVYGFAEMCMEVSSLGFGVHE